MRSFIFLSVFILYHHASYHYFSYLCIYTTEFEKTNKYSCHSFFVQWQTEPLMTSLFSAVISCDDRKLQIPAGVTL